ncbi:MAG: sulfotransferase [bacterium]
MSEMIGEVYIVLGMHRSGTSMVAGMLHRAGVSMGLPQDFYPPSSKENIKGFYENVHFRRVNDSILRIYGYVTKQWNPTFERSEQLRDSWALRNLPRIRFLRGLGYLYLVLKRRWLGHTMRSLLRRYSTRFGRWGWKDPRQMLTLPEWYTEIRALRMVNDLRVVFVFRHPLSVAVSMRKRGDIQTVAHGLAVWHLYNREAISFVRAHSIPTVVVSYESLVGGTPSTHAALRSFLQEPLSAPEILSFIDADLNRSGQERDCVELRGLDPDVNCLYEQLIGLSDSVIGLE